MTDGIKKELANYEAQEPGDGTVKLLRIFLKYLPENGKENSVDEIKSCQAHQDLRHLVHFRLMTLLSPIYTQPRAPISIR